MKQHISAICIPLAAICLCFSYALAGEWFWTENLARNELTGKRIETVYTTVKGALVIKVEGGASFRYQPKIEVRAELMPAGELVRGDGSMVDLDGSTLELVR